MSKCERNSGLRALPAHAPALKAASKTLLAKWDESQVFKKKKPALKLLSAYFQPAFNRAFAGLCGLWGRFLPPAKPVLNAPKAGSGGLSPGPKATLKTTVRLWWW